MDTVYDESPLQNRQVFLHLTNDKQIFGIFIFRHLGIGLLENT